MKSNGPQWVSDGKPMREGHAKLVEESSSGEEPPWCGDAQVTSELRSQVVEVEIQKNCHGAALLSIAQVYDPDYISENGRNQALGRLANGILLLLLGCGIQGGIDCPPLFLLRRENARPL